MDEMEIIILLCSFWGTAVFLKSWYGGVFNIYPKRENRLIKNMCALLPVLVFIIILYTLRNLASYDVVMSLIYIYFYIFLGFIWLAATMRFSFYCLNISWKDDVMENRNKAALWALVGILLGAALIYSGANIGDGPGWWCVIFAGGLGMIMWFILGAIMIKFTQVGDSITIDRNVGSGIRYGSYLLASGLILGRASSGDWTSFESTVIEFGVGWPVLFLALLVFLVELYYGHDSNSVEERIKNRIGSSIIWGSLYMIIAVTSVLFVGNFY
jgi:hypothetical protein